MFCFHHLSLFYDLVNFIIDWKSGGSVKKPLTISFVKNEKKTEIGVTYGFRSSLLSQTVLVRIFIWIRASLIPRNVFVNNMQDGIANSYLASIIYKKTRYI